MRKAIPWLITLVVLMLMVGAYLTGLHLGLHYMLAILLTGVLCVVAAIGLAVFCQPWMQHDNAAFSKMIWDVNRVQQGKRTLTDEEATKLDEKFKAFGESHPSSQVQAWRYAGDLHFARGNSRSAESCYQKAFDAAEPGSEQYKYCRHRIALCHLRLRYDKKALQEFEALAKESDFYTVGYANMLEFGWGTEPDPKKAMELFRRSLDAGNQAVMANYWEVKWFLENGAPGNSLADFAQYMRCCHDGRGARSGVHSLRQAAMAGYVPAQFELGTAYMDRLVGDSRQQQVKDGVAWLKKAADADYPPALYNLGIYTQRLCLDPATGVPAKPVIPGTLLYKNKVRYASYNAGMALIRRAAAAGYLPAQEVINMHQR